MIREAVAHSQSLAGVMRYLGIKPSGGQQASLKRRIERYQIDCAHFTGQGHRKGKPDPKRLAYHQVLVNRKGYHHRQKASTLRRALCESGRPYRCAGCDNDGLWRGKELLLQVDHIDGDVLNDVADNLRLLCPNCHSQTETFGSRNRRPSIPTAEEQR